MTVQTVPYALQNASHSAAVFRQAVSMAYTTGGVGASTELLVAQQGSPNMSVILGAGRAMIVGTSVSPPSGQSFTTQAMYHTLNDAPLTLTVSASNPTNPRIDAVYMQAQDSFYSGATNTAVAAIQAGTPAVSPVAPSIPANAILIAYIAVAANATSIVTANISQQTAVAATLPSPGVGMTKITGFTVGGTGVSVSSTGTVVLAAATAANINNCFTSAYDNYELYWDITNGSSAGYSFVFRVSGTDQTGSVYDTQSLSAIVAAANAAQTLAAQSWSFSSNPQPITSGKATIFKPAIAAAKTCILNVGSFANPMGASSASTYRTGLFRTATACDGFTFTASAGTMTGTLRIYGWNN